MSQKTIRNLVIFLLINAVLAVYIATNYFLKSLDDSKPKAEAQKTVSTTIQTKTNQVLVKPIVPDTNNFANSTQEVEKSSVENSKSLIVAEPANSAYKFATTSQNSVVNTASISTNQELDTAKVCVAMGPLNAEEKSTMDFILAKNKQTDLAKIEKLQSHQLYWNLGKSKSEAVKLFNKQKDGAMANPKFVLMQNQDKDWVVNITKVHGSEDVAKKLVKDLEDKAQKINAGGTWEYTTLPEGYFYKFNDFKSLKEVTINSIDIMLKVPKDPC